MSEESNGWVKPQRSRNKEELQALIQAKQAELASLEAELQDLIDGPRLEALVQVRNIMRAQALTLEDLGIVPPRPERPRKAAALVADRPAESQAA